MNGFTPVFTDINPRNLCMDDEQVISKITNKTRAVFITYVQGFNGLTDRLVAELEKRKIPLIEDVCEAHGATFKGRNLGTFGLAANFSFYFAHHMSTIEGGMVSVNDPELYEVLRMLRSHGMVREAVSDEVKSDYASKYSDLNPDFIFAYPGFNVRGTEIGGVLGRAQLKKLDSNNDERRDNLKFFLNNINPDIYRVDFELEGSCSYAFPLVMRNKDFDFRSRLEKALSEASVEFRRGSSGGGNQLRQPYLRKLMPHGEYKKYPEVEHIHFFGYYIGNYPSLEKDKISALCELLNGLK
jgi:CDP-6-deoxy-D-xylo-4-hexulose-3-dehydrase